MSINWVMLSETGSFVKLPGEQILYTSPPRTSIAIQSLNKFPAREPFNVSSSAGLLHLTNRRIVYIPAPSTPAFQSFAAPIRNLHDTHVTAPWIGANAWISLVQPVPSGGIPSHLPAVEARITFKDGGAYEFQDRFCRVKERLAQAQETRAMSGGGGGGSGADGDANVAEDVHLEQLPAYEALGTGSAIPSIIPSASAAIPSTDIPAPIPLSPSRSRTTAFSLIDMSDTSSPTNPTPAHAQEETSPSTSDLLAPSQATQPAATATPTPDEPPPGYEEAQRNSIVDELERGLRQRNTRGTRGEDTDGSDG